MVQILWEEEREQERERLNWGQVGGRREDDQVKLTLRGRTWGMGDGGEHSLYSYCVRGTVLDYN